MTRMTRMTRWAIFLGVMVSASMVSAQSPSLQLDSPVVRFVEAAPAAPSQVSPTVETGDPLRGAQQRLALWEIERHRAELERLWSEQPTFAGPLAVVGVGAGLAFGAFLDFTRRGLRRWTSGWWCDEEDCRDPWVRSRTAKVLGLGGTALALSGVVAWVIEARRRGRMGREIRRLEELLGDRLTD